MTKQEGAIPRALSAFSLALASAQTREIVLLSTCKKPHYRTSDAQV